MVSEKIASAFEATASLFAGATPAAIIDRYRGTRRRQHQAPVATLVRRFSSSEGFEILLAVETLKSLSVSRVRGAGQRLPPMVLIVSMAAEMRGVASNPLLALYDFWLHRKIGRNRAHADLAPSSAANDL